MPLAMEVGLGPGLIVLDGDPAPHQKIGAQSPFSAHVFCGQTAGWIKMSLVREIDVGPRDIVLDGDPAPTKKGHSTPTFLPMSIVAKLLDASRCHLVRR